MPKISQLPTASSVPLTALVPMVTGGATQAATVDQVKTGLTLIRDTNQLAFERALSSNGAVFNGSTDDSAAIQAALNIFTNSARGKVAFPSGLSTVISANGLTITAGLCGIDFAGLSMYCAASSGYALTVIGNPSPPYNDWSAVAPIENFRLLGPVTNTFTSTATGGSTTTIVDGTKNWATNAYAGVKVTNNTQNQSATVTSNTATTLTFAAMASANNSGDSYTVAGNDATATLMTGDGLFVGAPTGTTGAANQTLRNFQIKGFRDGWFLGNQAYVNAYYAADIEGNWRYGINGACQVNSGENINIHGGQISANCSVSKLAANGSAIAIYTPTGSDFELYLYGVSVDYNDKAFSINAGSINMYGGHIEDSHYGNTLGDVAYNSGLNTGVVIRGGVVSITESTANARANIFSVNGDQAYFDATPYWATYSRSSNMVNVTGGAPQINTRGGKIQLGVGATAWPTAGLASNLLADPGFESNSFTYWIQSVSGATPSVVTGGAQHSGTYAAQMVGTSGANISFAQQLIPVRAGERLLAQAWLNVTAFTSGNVQILLRFYINNGTTLLQSNNTTPLTATTGGYVKSVFQQTVPKGATHVTFLVYGSAFIGTFIVDDCELAAF